MLLFTWDGALAPVGGGLMLSPGCSWCRVDWWVLGLWVAVGGFWMCGGVGPWVVGRVGLGCVGCGLELILREFGVGMPVFGAFFAGFGVVERWELSKFVRYSSFLNLPHSGTN